MKLNSRQVADKLNISINTVRSLVEKKILTDLGVTKEGNKKHEFVFDSKQVNEVAKTYKPRKRFYTNGESESIQPESIQSESKTQGFNSRLDNIEKKLDLLLKLWS